MNDPRMSRYSRVTEILSPYSSYDMILPSVLEKAAERGKKIHALCELYARDGIQVPTEYDQYVNAFVKWFDREVHEVHGLEARLYCKTFEITGQFDMYVKLNDGGDYIIDIKTCAAKQDSWPLQLAAYQYLFGQNREGLMPRRAVLHLKKTGKYDFYEYTNDEKDQDLFMSALKLHRYFKKG
jgi:hypothetical protein